MLIKIKNIHQNEENADFFLTKIYENVLFVNFPLVLP